MAFFSHPYKLFSGSHHKMQQQWSLMHSVISLNLTQSPIIPRKPLQTSELLTLQTPAGPRFVMGHPQQRQPIEKYNYTGGGFEYLAQRKMVCI